MTVYVNLASSELTVRHLKFAPLERMVKFVRTNSNSSVPYRVEIVLVVVVLVMKEKTAKSRCLAAMD